MTLAAWTDVRPSKRQIDWQKLEFYGFVHFGMNTMTGREWGTGKESPESFDPANVDCDEWVRHLKKAGMKGAILTCKHHDGYCLWPSAYTAFTVASSPWKNGQGDLVRDFAEACKKHSMAFGIYLSPWDQHEHTYGTGKTYDDFYINQLKELLTNYGEVFSVWMDGANGEGENGKVQSYDWDRYYDTIRTYQPEAVISICGPDVRWVGNEAGVTRTNEWSVVPEALLDAEKIMEDSQHVDDGNFSESKVISSEEDLGSRKKLDETGGDVVWYPAEVDVSIRPGWFYHEDEDTQVKDAQELFDIYKRSVGNNTTLLLNVPPNKDGAFSPVDRKSLEELGEKLDDLYRENVLRQAEVTFSSNPLSYDPTDLFDPELTEHYWRSALADHSPYVRFDFKENVTINTLILKEFIPLSQRIEEISVYEGLGADKRLVLKGEAVGYQKIIAFPDIQVKNLWIEFKTYREFPTLHYIQASLLQ